MYCSENVWSNTTGKHLNAIQPSKKNRLPYEEFQRLLAKVAKYLASPNDVIDILENVALDGAPLA